MITLENREDILIHPSPSVNKKNPMSNEFEVATEIYHCEINGELIWYNKLVEELKPKMSKNTVSKAMKTLFDWGIIESEYGETSRGNPGKLLRIADDSKQVISELYNKYWQNK
jgi:predicted transcriptional regulator